MNIHHSGWILTAAGNCAQSGKRGQAIEKTAGLPYIGDTLTIF
jgi:hypothetical protein